MGIVEQARFSLQLLKAPEDSMPHRPDLRSVTRRQWLSGASGLSTLALMQQRGYADVTSTGASTRGTARAMILVNLQGAPSHVDTFDVKPGPWNPSDMNIQAGSGKVTLSQTLFPGLLKLSSDVALIRSVRSWEAVHERGQFYV